MPTKSHIPTLSTSDIDTQPDFVKHELPPTEGAEAIVSPPEKGKKSRHWSGSRQRAREKEKKIDPIKLSAKDEEHINEQITAIYENADGSIPDMSKFQKRQRRRFITALGTLATACAVLVAVAWFGFFVFQPKGVFSEADVILSVAGPEEAKVGEEIRYKIRYRNTEKVGLTAVKIHIRYPEGFVLGGSSPEPTNEKKDTWDIGALKSDASGLIELTGRMYGDVNQAQSFRVFMEYAPENFSSPFQKATTLAVAIKAGEFGLTIVGPTEVAAQGEATYTASIKRSDLPDSKVALELPEGSSFILKESQPKPDARTKNRWTLPADETFTLKLTGSFDKPADGESTALELRAIGWKDGDTSADPYVLGVAEQAVTIQETDLSANLVINGAAKEMTVQPGETLAGTVVIKNVGKIAVGNVAVRVVLDAPAHNKKSILDWTELVDEKNGNVVGEQLNDDRRRGSVQWDARQIAELKKLATGDSVTIDFALPIKDTEKNDLSDFPNGAITALLEVRYDQDGKQKEQTTVPINMTLLSDTTFEVRDKVDISSGAETHRVSFVISNSFHELKDLRVEVDIYGDVTVDKSLFAVPAGEATYDAATGKLVWIVPSMPTSVDVLAFEFPIVINKKNPTQTQLTSKISLHAADTIVGKEIIKVAQEIQFGASGRS